MCFSDTDYCKTLAFKSALDNLADWAPGLGRVVVQNQFGQLFSLFHYVGNLHL